MQVKELLARNTRDLITIREEDTLETAAGVLASNNIGALPVRDGDGNLVGVVSERDIARGFARDGARVRDLKVADLMTRTVITCDCEEDVKSAMESMSRKHIRHLPVMKDGRLCSMLSQRDVMEAMLEQTAMERDVLRDYAIAAR